MPNSRCYIQPLGRITPLLSQEGWREAPGWFHSETYRHSCFGYFRFSSDLIFG